MKILMLAPTYMDLYKSLKNELIRQGHTVFMIEDVKPRFVEDRWHHETWIGNCKGAIKRKLDCVVNIRRRYWKNKFKEIPQLNESYDFLLCINGSCFDPFLTEHLRLRNPRLRTSLYVWDSNKFADFFRSVPYFDRCFSFDWGDCRDNKRVQFLPIYYEPCQEIIPQAKYDISIIGTNHDGRARIVRCVERQIKSDPAIKYLFRIYVPQCGSSSLFRKIASRAKISVKRLLLHGNGFDWYEAMLQRGYMTEDFVSHELTPPTEVQNITLSSKCILDTDREIQTGFTPRLLWALASGKKIITTNAALKETPFYNVRQIRIIDRDNPVIDTDFIKNDEKFECPASLEQCRIDNWVKIILGEKEMKPFTLKKEAETQFRGGKNVVINKLQTLRIAA